MFIVAINSYFFDAVQQSDGTYDRVYNSEDVTSYLDKIVGNGVFLNPSTNLQVTAGSGMSVNVAAGQGWINGHKMINTATVSLPVASSDVLLGRIDCVIFYVDFSKRDMGIEIKEGAKATNPVAPSLTRTSQRYEMSLATIKINKQVTSITASMITDTRGNSSVCGYVQGLIQQMDTTDLFIGWQEESQNQLTTQQTNFDNFLTQSTTKSDNTINANDSAFKAWFDAVKEDLVSATLIRKYEYDVDASAGTNGTYNITTYIPQYAWELDILEVYVNGLRLDLSEYMNNNDGTITLATPVNVAGETIAFVVYKSVDGSDAESVVDQVEELQAVVNTLKTGMFVATGSNDNKKLSQVVQAFLKGADDYAQLEIDVYGDLAISEPDSTLNGVAYWFNFWVSSNTTRRVKLNFAHANRVVIDNTGVSSSVFMSSVNTEISNLQAVMNNCTTATMFENNVTCSSCAFWLNGIGDGTLIGALRGTFSNCRVSVTNATGKAYGFSGNNNVLSLSDVEVLVYNKSGASNEAVGVQVQGGATENVLMMSRCNCPVRPRGGYKQDNVVKVNSGFYCLNGNVLGKGAALYATGDGKTEIGTMIVSK